MASGGNFKYQLLSKEAEDGQQQHSIINRGLFGKKAVAFVSALTGAATLLLTLYLTGHISSRHSPPQSPELILKQYWLPSCGKTPAEAKAAGCIFDPMMNAWTPPECFDEELSLEFRSLRDWKFYKDQNATIELSEEEFSQAGDSWGSWEYHIAHCMFTFRKLHKALLHGGNIDREVGSEPHTEHCMTVTNVTFGLMEKARMNGETFSLQDMGTVLHTGYSRCFNAINLLPYDGVVVL